MGAPSFEGIVPNTAAGYNPESTGTVGSFTRCCGSRYTSGEPGIILTFGSENRMKTIHRVGFLCTAALLTLSPSLMAWQITVTDSYNGAAGTSTVLNGSAGVCASIPLAVNTQCLADSFGGPTGQNTVDNAYKIIGSVDAINIGGNFFYLDLRNVTVTLLHAGTVSSNSNVTFALTESFADTNVGFSTASDFMAGNCSGVTGGTATVTGNPMTITPGTSSASLNLLATCTGNAALAGTLSGLAPQFTLSPAGNKAFAETLGVAFGNGTTSGAVVNVSRLSLATPEPAALTLFGSGLLALAMLRRKIFRG
jgi:PEP-CTERM motif